MVGSIGDITDRKRAQEELLRLERRLRQAQRLEAMGTLAGGIAHDFNNILGAMLGFGERLLGTTPPVLKARVTWIASSPRASAAARSSIASSTSAATAPASVCLCTWKRSLPK